MSAKKLKSSNKNLVFYGIIASVVVLAIVAVGIGVSATDNNLPPQMPAEGLSSPNSSGDLPPPTQEYARISSAVNTSSSSTGSQSSNEGYGINVRRIENGYAVNVLGNSVVHLGQIKMVYFKGLTAEEEHLACDSLATTAYHGLATPTLISEMAGQEAPTAQYPFEAPRAFATVQDFPAVCLLLDYSGRSGAASKILASDYAPADPLLAWVGQDIYLINSRRITEEGGQYDPQSLEVNFGSRSSVGIADVRYYFIDTAPGADNRPILCKVWSTTVYLGHLQYGRSVWARNSQDSGQLAANVMEDHVVHNFMIPLGDGDGSRSDKTDAYGVCVLVVDSLGVSSVLFIEL